MESRRAACERKLNLAIASGFISSLRDFISFCFVGFTNLGSLWDLIAHIVG